MEKVQDYDVQERSDLSWLEEAKKPLSSAFLFSLYIPWIVSVALQGAPITSYLISWAGSFFIFYQTWASSRRFILPDLPVYQQIMRPLFIQQFIFAGYMCCTSIFYFLNILGYKYLEQVYEVDFFTVTAQIDLIAECQRLSVLGHAALVTGILLIQIKQLHFVPKYSPISRISKETWLIHVSIMSFILSFIVEKIPGFGQFSIGFYNVGVFCGAVVCVKGIVKRNERLLLWGGAIFLFNLAEASLTGYKEPIIINFLIIFCLLFPYYRKTIIVIAIPFFIFLMYVVPSYARVIRTQSWQGNATAEEARTEALESIFLDDEGGVEEYSNWSFLIERFSEMGMFTEFVKSTPEHISYYYTEILENSLLSIIPRAVWSDKPITETLAMERVYTAGVINRGSTVSAKTRPVVDGYLSAGFLGVFLYLLAIGAMSQYVCMKAERLLGGYEIGCVVFFNGFFQILWRGETMEFLLNSVFWSFISMLLLTKFLHWNNYLVKLNKAEN